MTMPEPTVANGTNAELKRGAPSCTLVIFGGSGDLARRKLMPALYNLLLDGALPDIAVLGVGRKPLSDDEFRAMARDSVAAYSRQALDEAKWGEFERRLFYAIGEIEDAETYPRIRSRAQAVEGELGLPGHRVFYLAIPPTSIAAAAEGLQDAGLVHRPVPDHPYSRVIVEKPIGRDLESAREINAILGRTFDESQVFRIDHYLGKETVQNLLVLRFANGIFEPLWNHKYIDHVEITVAEEKGVGSRAAYYEEAGALRDMVQNHILQLLSLVAMEPPWSLDPDVVRSARLEVLRSLRPIVGSRVNEYTVRGQYSPGVVNAEEVPGYRREPGVKPDSTVETFVALKAFIDNWRWAGVPFYVRTGKRLHRRVTEVALQFTRVPHLPFAAALSRGLGPNTLVLRIQPDEGITLRFGVKVPGQSFEVRSASMEMDYDEEFGAEPAEAYQRLLLDAMAGDPTLFIRSDEVHQAWRIVEPIMRAWQSDAAGPLCRYAAGTWGPRDADLLLARTGDRWREL